MAPAMAATFRVNVSGLARTKLESIAAEKDKLKRLFQQLGCDVRDVSLMVDRRSGKSRGFAFVDFEDVGSQDRALTLDPASQGALDLQDRVKGPVRVEKQAAADRRGGPHPGADHEGPTPESATLGVELGSWERPLLESAASGDRHGVQLALDRGAHVDARSPGGATPLILAATYGHAGAVRLLLESRADPALRTRGGRTAYDAAASVSADERSDPDRRLRCRQAAELLRGLH